MLSYFTYCFGVFLRGLAFPAVSLYAVGFVIRCVLLLFAARPCDGGER